MKSALCAPDGQGGGGVCADKCRTTDVPDTCVYSFDCVGFGFPFAWVFGRAGCALAHDHLGIASTSWLAVQFPDGPRLDLGLLEFFYTLGIAALFLALDRRPRPDGFFVFLFFAVYGPVRFVLDIFRTEDARYLGWTPGQFVALAATLLGIAGLVWVYHRMASSGGRWRFARNCSAWYPTRVRRRTACRRRC